MPHYGLASFWYYTIITELGREKKQIEYKNKNKLLFSMKQFGQIFLWTVIFSIFLMDLKRRPNALDKVANIYKFKHLC